MAYDNKFKRKVKTDRKRKKYINAIWTHLQARYCSPSWKVKIVLNPGLKHIRLNMDDSLSDYVMDRFSRKNKETLNGADLVAYLGIATEGNFLGFFGKAHLEGVCGDVR